MFDDLCHADIGPASVEFPRDEFSSLLGDARKKAHSRILRRGKPVPSGK
jgi:hypothetical protein